jgi:uncharacterized membrane protein
MMLFEAWFIFAIISALTGGTMSFLYKVAAKERLDIVLLSFLSSVFSAAVILLVLVFHAGFAGFWHPMLIFGATASLTFLAGNIFKVKALENIDAAVFFPLYKVAGPALVIVSGITLFNESFTVHEWVGLLISLSIPLLLISRVENARQVNLKNGLLWLCVIVLVGALSVSAWKHGTDIAPNIWAYIFTTEVVGVFAGALVLYKKGRLSLPYIQTAIRSFTYQKTQTAAAISTLVSSVVFVFAFASGGPLGIVYTINSLYILIPIVLALIYYKEHWNLRKATAIVLSIVALAFFA